MIELTYFSKTNIQSGSIAYQLIQFRPGEAWQIVNGDEVIGRMDKLHGVWNLRCWGEIPKNMATEIAELIEAQEFNQLPMAIKSHWEAYVHEVVLRSDSEYLVICKPGIDFDRFERLFKGCVSDLIKDPWEIRFCVYDSFMANDFEYCTKGANLNW